MDPRHPFLSSRSIQNLARSIWLLLRLQLPYLHRVISLIIHLIGVDKEGPLFRRSAAFGEIRFFRRFIPTGWFERDQKLASGYVMRVNVTWARFGKNGQTDSNLPPRKS